jgi:hypothetical protein
MCGADMEAAAATPTAAAGRAGGCGEARRLRLPQHCFHLLLSSSSFRGSRIEMVNF